MLTSKIHLLSISVSVLLTGCQQRPATNCAGKIIYAAPDGKSHDIYSIDPDGTNLQRLTDNDTFDGTPVISPQQDKIAFSSYDGENSSLRIMNVDGTSKVKVIDSKNFLSFPLWSHRENSFVFLQNEGSNLRELKELSLDTPEAVKAIQLDFPDSFTAHSLSRSPNGKFVAFGSLTAWRGGTHVHVIDLSTQTITNLTQQIGIASDPHWSPDGTSLVFVGAQQEPILEGGMSEIYTMHRSGADLKAIDVDLRGQKSQPVWSPDGASIAFINARNAIYSVNLDGSDLKKLTDLDDGSNSQVSVYEADLDWQAIPCSSIATRTQSNRLIH
ncbi:MAG: hypothetical protein AAGN15_17560 [Cyanobacteria bacterium J06581_3]